MAGKLTVRRHSLVVRITHWINVLAFVVLLGSGLQIFNAHPALYWGEASTFARPWIGMTAVERLSGEWVGITTAGGRVFETTGVLGFSGNQARGFPSWATIPSWRDLAAGRRWHFFFAWVLVLNGLVYLLSGLLGRHVRRDLLPTLEQLGPRHLWREARDHARLRFAKGEAARAYNALQKLTYLPVIFLLLPAMVLTGLCMSPAIGAAAPWLVELFGGRQSARAIHFLAAALLVLFTLVHAAMVVAAGPINHMRGMITGRYVIDSSGDPA
jgi:thiosulfate reductase cytochrome b subunit